MDKARRQKWLELCERTEGRPLCAYCKHLEVWDAGTWEYPESETVCTSPLIPLDSLVEATVLDHAMYGGDCWRFANKLPYKEASGGDS